MWGYCPDSKSMIPRRGLTHHQTCPHLRENNFFPPAVLQKGWLPVHISEFSVLHMSNDMLVSSFLEAQQNWDWPRCSQQQELPVTPHHGPVIFLKENHPLRLPSSKTPERRPTIQPTWPNHPTNMAQPSNQHGPTIQPTWPNHPTNPCFMGVLLFCIFDAVLPAGPEFRQQIHLKEEWFTSLKPT